MGRTMSALAKLLRDARAKTPKRSTAPLLSIVEDRGPRRPLPGPIFIVDLPLHTVSESNTRGHWAQRAKRAKSARGLAQLQLRSSLGPRPLDLPLVVTLTRVSPRGLDDDNLRGALKAVRDGVADYLAIDDRDPRVTWAYSQERGPRKTHLVRIAIMVRSEGA